MRRIFPAMFMLMFFWPVSAFAEKLIFATTVWPPYQYEEKGEMTGIGVDIVNRVCKRLDITPEIRLLPWKRALRDVRIGRAHGLVSALRTDERAEFMHYVSEPLFTVKVAIFARKEDHVDISGLADLKTPIGSVVSYSYGPEFDKHPGLKKVECSDDRELIRILDKGRIDVGVAHEGPFLFNCGKLGLRDRFKPVHVLSENPSFTTFSKTMGEKGQALADRFGAALRDMKKEGMVADIMKKYR